MPTEIRIPPLGESITEGVLARWLKRDGDRVEPSEPILELETDKATMEIPAEEGGRLEILEREGATVKPGSVVGRIHEGAAGRPRATASVAAGAPEPPAPASLRSDPGPADPRRPPPEPASAGMPPAAAAGPPAPAAPLSPAVRRIVAERGLDPAEMIGTGRGGRLTKADVGGAAWPAGVTAVAQRPATRPDTGRPAEAGGTAAAPEAARAGAGGEPAAADEIERVAMSPIRRRIAERLVEVQRTAAILTTFNEVDCSAVMAVRKQHRERFKARHGVDLGFMSLFARAVILATRDVPVVNASLDGDDIVFNRRVHLGIAVATPRGLIVPVVHRADALTLADLERAIAERASLAREGKLRPDQLAGGTFTITNGGVFGSLLSTPILNPPQSGILGMHKIQERPVAVDGQVVIRPMMYVALSYDHRLVDGEQAVTFLVRVKERLEDPVRMLLDA